MIELERLYTESLHLNCGDVTIQANDVNGAGQTLLTLRVYSEYGDYNLVTRINYPIDGVHYAINNIIRTIATALQTYARDEE